MVGPRWKKVFGDLWMNKTRTLLVVASIWIGVFATGVIGGSRGIVVHELQASYEDTKPAHSMVYVSDDDSFGDDLVEAIRKVDGVADAEGRRLAVVRVEEALGTWQDLQLTAVSDFEDIRVNQIRLVQGALKPRDKEVVLERSSVGMLGVAVGDAIVVERADGKRKVMRVAGIVHDLSVQPSSMSGRYYGFVTLGTMGWLGEKTDYTRMLVRVASEPSLAGGRMGMALGGRGDVPSMHQIVRVLGAVEDKMKRSGRDPQMPRGPHGGPSNEHWATSFISNLSMMMSVLGVMSLFLSGFLVTNTIAALLAQQVKQIGIMKAIGARDHQVMGMYMVLVLGFGGLAMVLALPLTLVVTRVFVDYVAGYFNFDLSGATFPRSVLLVQVFASLFVPVVASVVPVFTGTRITVYEAIHRDGIAQSVRRGRKRELGPGRVSRLGMVLSTVLNRPLLLSLRNTFRRKGRVALTLLTLTFGGMIFVGIFTIRNSLVLTLDDFIAREFRFDLVVVFDRTYRDYYVIDAVRRLPGIVNAESWSSGSARRVYGDGGESEDISVTALPPGTTMLSPMVVDGRWLVKDDENAVVVTTGVLEKDSDIAVGDVVVLQVNGRESGWRVVGVTTGMGSSREMYVPYDYYTRLTGEVGQTRMLRVQTVGRTLEEQRRVGEGVQDSLRREGIDVDKVFFMTDMRERVVERFDFVVMALMVMAMLMAVVGGLGLAGTMSLNVIERTKEIGVMRAIGASNGVMMQVFLGEGLLIGLLSWLGGSLLALPVSKVLCDAMGQLFFRTPLSFSFSVRGVFVWLGFSVVLAVISSFLPAWNATRLTVRDVLAYE